MQQQPQQQQQQQQQPSALERPPTLRQRKLQLAEFLRNKGIICRTYLEYGECPRAPDCPYSHISDGQTRPIPWDVCSFFASGVCLRENCPYFHGTKAELEALRASGATHYTLQHHMAIADPPSEYLNPDGSLCAARFDPAETVRRPHANTVNSANTAASGSTVSGTGSGSAIANSHVNSTSNPLPQPVARPAMAAPVYQQRQPQPQQQLQPPPPQFPFLMQQPQSQPQLMYVPGHGDAQVVLVSPPGMGVYGQPVYAPQVAYAVPAQPGLQGYPMPMQQVVYPYLQYQ